MDPLTFRMEEEGAFLRSLICLVRPGYYPEAQLFQQLKERLPVDNYFSEEELRRLRAINVEKHWQFVALSIGRIRQLFPGSRWREILSRYVATFALLPGFEFAEEDLRRLRDEPVDVFATSEGVPLHWSLREALQRFPQECREAPLRDAVFDTLEAHKIRFVADYVFHNQQKLFDMLGVWGIAGTVNYQQDLFSALNSLMRRIGISVLARCPTAAEQTVLDNLPRP